ncbi:cytidylyltransferase domain-containing protein [Pseudoalteromonas phenolica]|uniref:acylneuraminate cytidylyltransferase family protein n=1 Tax=Pseudoalteromonas phenolica TaxID=161398 RepID=UPI00110C03FB|nr:acylneuraminate cytidylyltransferase family protein [Pseudoalteromonas phenolica]TMO54076.1 acylneuraminate cytidylyltransferase family protein [Pseudoalteromonas phenolica]
MIAALITARGGSKGLPRKNVLLLNNKPVISWTCEAALASNYIQEVYVSTEDSEIKMLSSFGGIKHIERPEELASDTASSIDVIQHALENLFNQNKEVETLVLLQPTSPLRTSNDIDEAIALYEKKHANMVISVFEPSNPPIKAYYEDKTGQLRGVFTEDAPYTRRQDLPKSYQPNGAIYVINVKSFQKNNTLPKNKVFPYVMSEALSADIDTIDDFLEIEKLMKEKQ